MPVSQLVFSQQKKVIMWLCLKQSASILHSIYILYIIMTAVFKKRDSTHYAMKNWYAMLSHGLTITQGINLLVSSYCLGLNMITLHPVLCNHF